MDYKWEATQRDQHGTSVISSRQALDSVGAGATITVEASGRCNGPFVRLSAMQSWSSVVHNRDPDRSGDVYVELNYLLNVHAEMAAVTPCVGTIVHAGMAAVTEYIATSVHVYSQPYSRPCTWEWPQRQRIALYLCIGVCIEHCTDV
jgi:hypothetical protein